MKTTQTITSIAMPFFSETTKQQGWVIELESNITNNNKLNEESSFIFKKETKLWKRFSPTYLTWGFLNGIFDEYANPFNHKLLLNRQTDISTSLDDEQKMIIRNIVEDTSILVRIMKSRVEFEKLSEYDKFVYQFLYHMYHKFVHAPENINEKVNHIGTIFLSKIPIKYFEQLIGYVGVGKSYLIIQSILYEINIKLIDESNLIDIQPLGITNSTNTRFISFDSIAEDKTLFGSTLVNLIDYSSVKDNLNKNRAKLKLGIMADNINQMGSNLEVKQGDSLRDVLTKYTVMSTLSKDSVNEEQEQIDKPVNNVVYKNDLHKQNVNKNHDEKSKEFANELDGLLLDLT